MSCPHPEHARQTRTTSLNPSATQTETACAICGAILNIKTKEVPER